MTAIDITSSWDLIETPSRDVVITIQPGHRPTTVLAAGDGLYVGTEGPPLRLEKSAHLVDVIKRARSVVISEADEAIVRETLVQIKVDGSDFARETTDE